jgi:hypothetical protein
MASLQETKEIVQVEKLDQCHGLLGITPLYLDVFWKT